VRNWHNLHEHPVGLYFHQSVLLNVTATRAERSLPQLPVFGPQPAPPKARFVVLGDQEGWKGYVTAEFYELFRALRYAFNWDYINGGSWHEVAEALASFGGESGARQPTVLLVMEFWSILQWGPKDPRLDGTQVWFMADDQRPLRALPNPTQAPLRPM